MNKAELIVSNSIIRIVGVFELKSSMKSSVQLFQQNNYCTEIQTIEKNKDHLKNYWYPEFRDMYFFNREASSSTILNKQLNEPIQFVLRVDHKTNEKTIFNCEVVSSEVFLFNKQLNFFSIELKSSDSQLSSISDLTFCARNFSTKVLTEVGDVNWVNWIEKNFLCGTLISSSEATTKVKVDDYSGSKFKLFTILSLEETIDKSSRLELLYDIGSVAKIGSAGGNYSFTPSDEYYTELMSNCISIFNNYDILPLFDSFTVIGNDVLETLVDKEKGSFKNDTWSNYYFRIYIHNLFIKFNLFRYNSEMIENSVEVRNQFEYFLNTYNLKHISYNFLPNHINQNLRSSLDIDHELEVFQERINRISQSISEQKQNRANLLLGFVGLVTSLSGISPALDVINSVKSTLGWSDLSFYLVLALVVIALAIPLVIFLFPDKVKRIKRKLRKD